MNRIIKKACKICSNINLPYFDELLLANTTSKIHAISIDVHHPIAAQIVLSSDRTSRSTWNVKRKDIENHLFLQEFEHCEKPEFSLKVFYVLKK